MPGPSAQSTLSKLSTLSTRSAPSGPSASSDVAATLSLAIGGLTQAARRFAPLDAGFARLDDRSFAELVDAAIRIAGLVRYYDADDRPDGDWVPLLTREPVIVLAAIAAIDVQRVEHRLEALVRRTRMTVDLDRKRARLAALWDAALDLPRQIERWDRGLAGHTAHPLGVDWSTAIAAAIKRDLAPAVRQLRAWDLGAASPGSLEASIGADYRGFGPRWEIESIVPDATPYVGGSVAERIDALLGRVLPLWRPIGQQISTWSARARPQLDRTLADEDGIAPHVALLLAFLRVFDTAQHSVNAFASRRTTYYYGEVLGERPRPAQLDGAHVAFTCDPTAAASVTVPTGTRLSAGTDAARQPVVFVTQHAVTATPASLSRLMTLRIEPAPDDRPGTGRVAQRVLARTIAVDDPPWATFGSTADEPAEIGFALSAPALHLSGGERHVELQLRLPPAADAWRDALQAIAEPLGVSRASVRDQVLGTALTLQASTADGWYTVPACSAAGPGDDAGGSAVLTLRFVLPSHAPAIRPTPGAASGGPHPVVRALVRQQPVRIAGPKGTAEVYPLTVLNHLRLAGAAVRVEVKGLPSCRVITPDGEADTSKPFAPFGAAALGGSVLRLRHAELFSKRLERLTIRLRWFDLPLQRTGFRGYYRRYVVDADGIERPCLFDNQSFRVAISAEQPGPWVIPPAADAQQAYLFRTPGTADSAPEPERALAPATALAVATAGGPGVPQGYTPEESAIRIELRQPAYGFGTNLFGPNMAHAMAAAAPSPGGEGPCAAAYKPIADARLRLDELLGSGRLKQVSAALDTVPTPSWPSQPGGHVRSTIRDFSGSWRALLRRRPGIEESTEWLVRNQEAQLDDERPEESSYREAVQRTVTSILRTLLDEAGDGLAVALEDTQDRLDGPEWLDWMRRLDQARHGSHRDRLLALNALHAEAVDAWRTSPRTAPALERSRAMLLAASLVQDCDTQADHVDARYGRSVRANLRTCVSLLEALHDRSIELCKAQPPLPAVPLAPYVPRIDTLDVDYVASGPADVMHVLPFGGWSPLTSGAAPPTLLPQFAHAGNLILGLTGLTTPQTLRLFALLRPQPGLSTGSEPAWEYLDDRGWVRLSAPHADADTTQGLRHSGTISLALPAVGPPCSTWLPPGCHWIRAVVPDPDRFPETSALLLNAVLAVRQPAGTGPAFERPLAAGSIKALVAPVPGITAVTQPGPSFGGRPAESGDAFQTRVAERLRHKGRAVTTWDYERLVLEEFPEIWRAAATAARPRRAGAGPAAGTGYVQVTVVPGPTCPDVTDPATPVLGQERLAAVRRMLESRAAPGVRVLVHNPTYVRLRVSAVMTWRAEADPSASVRALESALVAYLSPWRAEVLETGIGVEAEVRRFIESRADVASIRSLSIAYDHASEAATASGLMVATSAPSHAIVTATEAPPRLVDGY